MSPWFLIWPWLHYIEDQNMVLCFICARANLEECLSWSSNADSAFVTKGFCNWKDASVKFSINSSTKCHKEAVLKIVTLPFTT